VIHETIFEQQIVGKIIRLVSIKVCGSSKEAAIDRSIVSSTTRIPKELENYKYASESRIAENQILWTGRDKIVGNLNVTVRGIDE
jgi:hypothetical protein